ncbi:helix-turn-helix transcriptional regulator [Streptomyces mirabilis]|uniref:helix-turn-helix transcriptional regulator n=1 Tax=Streptomyces mirabilis TaxID=68239 RepID=UPI00381C1AC4
MPVTYGRQASWGTGEPSSAAHTGEALPAEVPLVGRHAEIAHLRALRAQVRSGRGASVMFEGESGIGKTTLLDAAARACRAEGFLVVRGAAASEQEAAFPLFRSCRRPEDPAWGAGFSGLFQEGPDAAGTGWEFSAAEQILAQVDGWCEQVPVALLLDDVHWADSCDLAALCQLQHLVPQIPLLIAAAARSTAQSAAMAAARRSLGERGMAVVPVPALTEEEVAQLLTRHLGARPSAALLDRMSAAAGNPLFVTEMVTALADSLRIADGVADIQAPRPGVRDEEMPGSRRTVTEIRDPVGEAALPRPLKDAILRRLTDLPPDTRDVLDVAAVMGAQVTLSDLSVVTGTGVMGVWEAVRAAVDVGLLSDTGDHLTFRHDLVHQALLENLSADTRTALRLQAGNRLARAGAPPAQIAGYLRRARSPIDSRTVDSMLDTAAAMTHQAPALAADVLGRALTTLSGDDDRRGPLSVHAAEAHLRAGEPAEAEKTAREALGNSPAPPIGSQLRWLLAQSEYRQGRLNEAAQEAQAALACPGTQDPARFHAFAAQCHFLLGRPAAAGEHARRAVAAGEAVGDAYCTAHGTSMLAALQLNALRPAEALELTDQALMLLGNQEIQADLQMAPHFVRGLALTELDRGAEAHLAFDRGLHACDRGANIFLTWYHVGKANLHFNEGRWDDALAETSAGLETIDHLGLSQALHSQAALIAVHRGDLDTYADLVEQPDDTLGGTHCAFLRLWARALTREARGRPDQALDLLFNAWQQGVNSMSQPFLYRMGPDIARLAAAEADQDKLRRLTHALETLDTTGASTDVHAVLLLCRGMQSANAQEVLQAAEAFSRTGRVLYEAYSREAAAQLLAADGRTTTARAALQAALTLYERLDAAWDAGRAEQRMAAAGIRVRRRAPRGPRTGWDALTQTERAIVAHVAQGCSNPDVGARLFLSPRTVQFHLSTIFTKLGVSSRVELAVSARQHGANDADNPAGIPR